MLVQLGSCSGGCWAVSALLSLTPIIPSPSYTSHLSPHTSLPLSQPHRIHFILFLIIYFCLLTIFSESRRSPCLYGESVITSMLCSAAILYWSASALVLLRPSDLLTRLQAVSTSPGELNFLMINFSSSGNSWLANKTGAVARPSPRSATAGLPAGKSSKKNLSTRLNPSHPECLQWR